MPSMPRMPSSPAGLLVRRGRYSCAMSDERKGGVRSVARAVRALELIAEEGELGVTDLGRGLGVHKATASRLAATLADGGLIERDPVSDRYRLGLGLIRLVGAAMASIDLVRTAHPVLEELADRTRETVNIGVLSGDGVVYLDQVSSAHLVASTNWVGRRTPLHCTSSGKVFLAHMPEPNRQQLLARPLEALTPRTVTDPARLRRQLDEIRVRGYATIQEEIEEGLNAVAAPIRQLNGDVAAALSVSGPSFRVRPVDLARLGRLTIDAAGAISRRLGYRS
jgi:IclR family transcriptional regulator, acetate operon repressor